MGRLLIEIWTGLSFIESISGSILQRCNQDCPRPKQLPFRLHRAQDEWSTRCREGVQYQRVPSHAAEKSDFVATLPIVSRRLSQAKGRCKAWISGCIEAQSGRRCLCEKMDANSTCDHVPSVQQSGLSQFPRPHWNHAQFGNEDCDLR